MSPEAAERPTPINDPAPRSPYWFGEFTAETAPLILARFNELLDGQRFTVVTANSYDEDSERFSAIEVRTGQRMPGPATLRSDGWEHLSWSTGTWSMGVMSRAPDEAGGTRAQEGRREARLGRLQLRPPPGHHRPLRAGRLPAAVDPRNRAPRGRRVSATPPEPEQERVWVHAAKGTVRGVLVRETDEWLWVRLTIDHRLRYGAEANRGRVDARGEVMQLRRSRMTELVPTPPLDPAIAQGTA